MSPLVYAWIPVIVIGWLLVRVVDETVANGKKLDQLNHVLGRIHDKMYYGHDRL